MSKTYQLLYFHANHQHILDFFERQEQIWNLEKVLPGNIPDFLFVEWEYWALVRKEKLPASRTKVLLTGEICTLWFWFDIICCPNYVPFRIFQSTRFVYYPSFLFSKGILWISKKNNTRNKNNILFLYSNPFPYFRRYLCLAIQKFHPVDCPGRVLNNRINTSDRYTEDWHQQKNQMLSSYKYCLACENSHMPGYITEKFWDCLGAGTIPIYLGAPDIASFVSDECYVDVRKYIPRIYFFFSDCILRFFPPVGYRRIYHLVRFLEWGIQFFVWLFIPWGKIAKRIISDDPQKRQITIEELEVLDQHRICFFDMLQSVIISEKW